MNTAEMTQQRKHNRISKHSKMIIADTRDSLSYSISCFLTRLQTRKRAKRMCSVILATGSHLYELEDACTCWGGGGGRSIRLLEGHDTHQRRNQACRRLLQIQSAALINKSTRRRRTGSKVQSQGQAFYGTVKLQGSPESVAACGAGFPSSPAAVPR